MRTVRIVLRLNTVHELTAALGTTNNQQEQTVCPTDHHNTTETMPQENAKAATLNAKSALEG